MHMDSKSSKEVSQISRRWIKIIFTICQRIISIKMRRNQLSQGYEYLIQLNDYSQDIFSKIFIGK